jgi:DNA-directed RNA polymerase subunit RPC12/RpoP
MAMSKSFQGWCTTCNKVVTVGEKPADCPHCHDRLIFKSRWSKMWDAIGDAIGNAKFGG